MVVTGMGAVTPIGNDVAHFWKALLEGQSGVARMDRFDPSPFPSQVAAQVKNFEASAFLSAKEVRETTLFSQFLMAAATEAMAQAGLAPEHENPQRCAVFVGTACAGMLAFDEATRTFLEQGPRRVRPHLLTETLGNMPAARLSMRYHFEGPNETLVTACASGTSAIGRGLRAIRWGEADVALCGGTDAPLVESLFAAICAMRALTTQNDPPEAASRPFDRSRDGFVIAEGAGVLVLESLSHAKKRGAEILGEVTGFATFGDGYHLVAPAPDGRGERRAIAAALKDARRRPEEVTYVNAHATGTPEGDRVEAESIAALFGPRGVPVSSIKGATGHTIGAAGVIEAIATLLAIRDGVLPHTIHLQQPDPDLPVDFIMESPRPAKIGVAVSESFGFGGENAVLVLERFTE